MKEVEGMASRMVVRAVAELEEIINLAKVLQMDFLPTAIIVIPSLIRNTYVTVKVISSNSATALTTILEAIPSTSFIPPLAEALTDVHDKARAAAADSIATITKLTAGGSEWEANDRLLIKEVAAHIKMMVEDRGANVRAKGKRCFAVFKKHYLADAEALLASIVDVRAKKLLTGTAASSSPRARKGAGSPKRIGIRQRMAMEKKKKEQEAAAAAAG